MDSDDDWEGLPEVGTRVRVPYLTSTHSTKEGEVILLYRLFGRPVARVSVQVPVSYEASETRAVQAAFSRDELEIIPD
jgi:hypothetical protein